MGLASMTGFARAQGEAHGISWAWEIKSVNGRGLDLRLRLGPGFDSLEPELRAGLSQRFRRGNVSATLTVARTQPPGLRINRAALAQLMALVDELGGEIEAAPPRIDGLLALRGVIETVEEDDEPVAAARRGDMLRGWAGALDRLAAARVEEGARVGVLLRGQLDEMAALAAAAADCAAAQPAAIRERLLAALAGLVGPGAPAMPEERVAQEVALLAARADIREEIERLRAHVAQAGDLIDEGEAVGRRLDFLCQELNREANTLCSKSADIALTRTGLALKAVIEQFREQVQNIE
ncbi:MAG TPA: YicC/YloC family endoribonuclease [Stellaceae bacterium]|nr:YicC/YloC family endoribonuclease [Stellaceae bacterium]